jgi:hypothetical protein
LFPYKIPYLARQLSQKPNPGSFGRHDREFNTGGLSYHGRRKKYT